MGSLQWFPRVAGAAVWALRKLPSAGFGWRFGVANAARRPWLAVIQIASLSIGLMALLTLTVVRGGLNSRGKDVPPVATNDWPDARNSWMPVSYAAMARWMVEEATANRYVHAAPLVSRGR